MSSLPTVFVSHGAPNLVIDDAPATDFLRRFGGRLGTPAAVVVVSAHFEADDPLVSADDSPAMMYDFGGFEPELYEMLYPAPGDPGLARRIKDLLRSEGFQADEATGRGFDHGTWVPMMLLYPEANVPVVQLSVSPAQDAAYHYRMGQALRPLHEDNILILGSGSLTHNLSAFFRGGFAKDAEPPDWVEAFADWMHDHVTAGSIDALLDYRQRAPHAAENHPTQEHLLPFFVAAGAAVSGGTRGERVHASSSHGVLAMDAYTFG
ncbi:MAG: DODA-type extradiol aromatic ring-opening family dioxygenase [Hyphomicrobiales bacterium]